MPRSSKHGFRRVEEYLSEIKKYLLKSNGQLVMPDKLLGYDLQIRTLTDALKRTVVYGENNQIVVTGPRGSGKTTFVKLVLKEILEENPLDVVVINLNGYLQTDSSIAINEITRQLKMESISERRVFGSFAENLAFLLESLNTGGRKAKAVIFFLDEFEMFCRHHNQTLIYNLFDISQSSKNSVSVVGLTRQLDVLELMEKRVKSRFSHRQIHLIPNIEFEHYQQFAETSLLLPVDFMNANFYSEWNENISNLIRQNKVVDILKLLFSFHKDIGSLKSFLTILIHFLNVDNPELTETNFTDSWEKFSQDSQQLMVNGVSVLELCLLLSMRRLVEIYDGAPFNFEMVCKEYQKFAATRSTFNFDKRVVMKAFENLVKLQFVIPVEYANMNIQKGYRMMHLALDPSQVMNMLQTYPYLPTEVKQWSSTLIA